MAALYGAPPIVHLIASTSMATGWSDLDYSAVDAQREHSVEVAFEKRANASSRGCLSRGEGNFDMVHEISPGFFELLLYFYRDDDIIRTHCVGVCQKTQSGLGNCSYNI